MNDTWNDELSSVVFAIAMQLQYKTSGGQSSTKEISFLLKNNLQSYCLPYELYVLTASL